MPDGRFNAYVIAGMMSVMLLFVAIIGHSWAALAWIVISVPSVLGGEEISVIRWNGKKATFVGVHPNGRNMFYHHDDASVFLYKGTRFTDDAISNYDIILEKKPREFWANEYPAGFEIFLTEEEAKEYIDEGCLKTFRVQEIIE
jgi:hypothetical protein